MECGHRCEDNCIGCRLAIHFNSDAHGGGSANGGSDDDGVFVGCHGVLYVGQNEQEAANGMRLEVLKVERFAKADLPLFPTSASSKLRISILVRPPISTHSRVKSPNATSLYRIPLH